MPLKRLILLVVSLGLFFLIIFVSLEMAQHPKIDKLRFDFKDKTGILLANLSEILAPPRRHPLSTLELEENLKLNLAVPFAKFTEDDWNWFWHLLYGRHVADLQGWPRRKRQLTKEEIENALVNYYYRPFGNFDQRKWQIFWRNTLKDLAFKR